MNYKRIFKTARGIAAFILAGLIVAVIRLNGTTMPILSQNTVFAHEKNAEEMPTAPEIQTIPAEMQNSVPVLIPTSGTSGNPVRLLIPSIREDIPVIPVGITADGLMDTPHSFTEAGWYSGGSMPGQLGSAVIDAHVDNGGFSPTIPGVFKNLNQLKTGDDIEVVTNDGSKLDFAVTGSAIYKYSDVPTEVLFTQNDQRYLKLITCAGKWDPAKKTYDQRLIVTAVLRST